MSVHKKTEQGVRDVAPSGKGGLTNSAAPRRGFETMTMGEERESLRDVLGVDFGGSLSATVSARPVMKSARAQFLRNFGYAMNEEEREAWKIREVQAAYEFLSKLHIEEQLKFIEDPEQYLTRNNYPVVFGIRAGIRREGPRNTETVIVAAIAKNLKANLINKLAR